MKRIKRTNFRVSGTREIQVGLDRNQLSLFFSRLSLLVTSIVWRVHTVIVRPSVTERHWHVTVTFRDRLERYDRIALRAGLCRDPKRDLLDLLQKGWKFKRYVGSHRILEPGDLPHVGSHRILERADWPDFTFAFNDEHEIGPVALALIAKKTGLKPEDL